MGNGGPRVIPQVWEQIIHFRILFCVFPFICKTHFHLAPCACGSKGAFIRCCLPLENKQIRDYNNLGSCNLTRNSFSVVFPYVLFVLHDKNPFICCLNDIKDVNIHLDVHTLSSALAQKWIFKKYMYYQGEWITWSMFFHVILFLCIGWNGDPCASHSIVCHHTVCCGQMDPESRDTLLLIWQWVGLHKLSTWRSPLPGTQDLL